MIDIKVAESLDNYCRSKHIGFIYASKSSKLIKTISKHDLIPFTLHNISLIILYSLYNITFTFIYFFMFVIIIFIRIFFFIIITIRTIIIISIIFFITFY